MVGTPRNPTPSRHDTMSLNLSDSRVLLKLINDDKFLRYVLTKADIPAEDKMMIVVSVTALRLEFPNGISMDTLQARLKGSKNEDSLD